MENESGDFKELNQHLADGYLIDVSVHCLGRLSPQTIDRFTSFYSIKTAAAILLDPSNSDKYLIILGHPTTGSRFELITSDDATMLRVATQLSYQKERIGTLIRARCVAVDNRLPERPACHGLDRLVESLNGRWGWNFRLLEGVIPAFQVELRLESTNSVDIEIAKDKLKGLLDCLAVSQNIGFYIQEIFEGPIRRCSLNPYAVAVGPEERMLEALSFEEISNIEAVLSSPKAKAAARGLNQAYSENFVPSKLAMLWAAVEDVFSTDPERLLKENERTILLKAAKDIETLVNNNERMRELIQVLSDPNRLPLKTKNRRMATAIAPIMGIDEDEVYRRLQIASDMRGKQLHSIRGNWGELQTSVDFLQEALRRYLAQQKMF